MEIKKYIEIKDLEVYKLAEELSEISWEIYEGLNWQDKKIMGEQLKTSFLPRIKYGVNSSRETSFLRKQESRK